MYFLSKLLRNITGNTYYCVYKPKNNLFFIKVRIAALAARLPVLMRGQKNPRAAFRAWLVFSLNFAASSLVELPYLHGLFLDFLLLCHFNCYFCCLLFFIGI